MKILRPPRISHWDQDWARLTTGDTLFSELRDAVKRGDRFPALDWFAGPRFTFEELRLLGQGRHVSGLARFLKNYYVDALERPSEAQARWEILGRMLWCFERALTAPAFDEAELPDFSSAGVARHAAVGSRSATRAAELDWAHMCVRCLRGENPTRRAVVHVALCDNDEAVKRGFLASLELELLSDGCGRLASRPATAFDTIYYRHFDDSMRSAWQAARAAATSSAAWDGLWRVVSHNALKSVDGPSASGAAARGWWYLLEEKIPDPEVIVLAQVVGDDIFSLEDVEGFTAKLTAIVDDGIKDGHRAFDTILVAGAESKGKADVFIDDRGLSQKIRVLTVRLDVSARTPDRR